MKTNLQRNITTVQDVQSFIEDLHNNGEAFHFDDDPATIFWAPNDFVAGQPADYTRLNDCVGQMFKVCGPVVDGEYEVFDPFMYAIALQDD